ncbi:hypothetical protein BDN70DRAFT_291185 [Pholiota conissans]|uniref:Uncharacterized protein n=1 Tax=Pholiota conissans TaxID=109636 RepID=A0A9P5Z9H2_9AGAR|nr:hypothetical protein BDN70DRAFT_291185 [Pholiota conissans]
MPMRLAGDFNVGAQLIGICINLVLYGVELVLAACYLSSARAKRDRKFILFAVISSLIVDTLACIALCAGIFMLLIVDWGRNADFLSVNWTTPLWIFTTGLNEFVVEGFMDQRYYRLSSNSVISFLIFVLMLLSLSASLYLGVDVSKAT